jgi:hypothetical protein
VPACDKRYRFFVIHRHAAKGFANVIGLMQADQVFR